MEFLQKAITWLMDNLYNYMIPVCLLCVLRVVICLIELRHMKRLRDKKFMFRSVSNHYKEIGAFIGLFIGSVLVCVLPLKLLWGVVAVVLAVIGFKVGAKKGAEADEFWRQVIEEIKASEDAEVLENVPVLSNDVGALLDTLDVYGDEEETAEPAEEESAVSEEAAEENVEE